MKLSIPSGTTSKRIGIFIQDSSSTVGAGLSGLAFNTSGLKCYSWIDTDGNAAGTAQTLATATLGTWTTIGFVEKDATNMKGMYEFGIPNALIAAGVKWCFVYFYGATNMAPLVLEIEVTAVSNQDGVHGGMSALPNTACTTNASLLTSGTGTDQLQVTAGLASANAKQINAVATTSVTTVAAVVGTTIAPTFTGSLIKSDVTDWNGTAVSAPATAGIPEVNVKNMNNVSAAAITTVKAVQGLAVDGVIPTATNLTNAPTAGDLTAAMQTTITSLVDAAIVDASLDLVYAKLLSGVALTASERNSTADAILARSMGTEGYAAKGATPTVAQALFMILQDMQERSIAGTTYTVKGLDGSTAKMTYTLDSSSAPTSKTRAT